MGNEEIIGVATKFFKANCYSPNPKSYIVKVSWKLGSLTNIYERWKFFMCYTLHVWTGDSTMAPCLSPKSLRTSPLRI